MMESINKNKFILGIVGTFLVTWGGLTYQVASSKEKDKEQDARFVLHDKKIESIKVDVNDLDKADQLLANEQGHITEDLDEIKEVQKEIKQGQQEIINAIMNGKSGG